MTNTAFDEQSDDEVKPPAIKGRSTLDVETQSLHFIPEKIGASYVEPPAAVRNARFASHKYLMYDQMIHTLTTYVLKSEHAQQRVHHFKLPLNWWEHLKESHAPEWLKKRWPVQYEKRPFHYTEHTHLCPHADVPWPADEHLEFMIQKPLRKGDF